VRLEDVVHDPFFVHDQTVDGERGGEVRIPGVAGTGDWSRQRVTPSATADESAVR
jgi:hypothetical protein